MQIDPRLLRFIAHSAGAIFVAYAGAPLTFAQENNGTTLRKAAIDVFAGHTTARLLRGLADECAPERRDAHTAAFGQWETTYKLRGFDTLFARQLSAKERELLEQQVQVQMLPRLRQKFTNCVSSNLNALYTSASMNPGNSGRDASLAMVQNSLAGTAVDSSAPAPLALPAPAAPTPRGGSADFSALEGVYLNQSTGFGVGGMMTIEFDAYAVFKDGTISADVNSLVTQSGARDPKKWGRWQRSGNGFRVTWNNGKTSELSGSTFYKTFAAKPGETLNGTYRSIGGGGNTALGGGTMIFDASIITFFPDGRFDTSSAKGGSAPGVVTSARGASSGTYRLDAHMIEMRYSDGRTARSAFYFYPAKGEKTTRAIGIGNRDYTKS